MDDYYKKVTLWGYDAEIMTGCYVKDINEPKINKIIAVLLISDLLAPETEIVDQPIHLEPKVTPLVRLDAGKKC